jgi:hypothetical protein
MFSRYLKLSMQEAKWPQTFLYKAAKDEKFVKYIEKKEEYYEEGNALWAHEPRQDQVVHP